MKKHRCSCGTDVSITHLNGALRTQCPICGAAIPDFLFADRDKLAVAESLPVANDSCPVKEKRTDPSRRYRGLITAMVTTWSVFVVYYAATLTMHETGVAFGSWCGTCVAGAQHSLFITNPLLLSTSIFALIIARRQKSKIYPLVRTLSSATFAIVISPVCIIAWAIWIE